MAGRVSGEKERTIAELQARYCTEVNYDASKFNSDLWDSGYAQALEDAARVAQQFAEVSEGAGKTSALAIAAELKRRSLAKGKEGLNDQS